MCSPNEPRVAPAHYKHIFSDARAIGFKLVVGCIGFKRPVNRLWHAMKRHHAGVVIERNHRRTRQFCKTPTQDVTKCIFGPLVVLEADPRVVGQRTWVTEWNARRREGTEGPIRLATGQRCPKFLQPQPDSKRIIPANAVVTRSDNPAKFDALNAREHGLKRIEVAVDVRHHKQRAPNRAVICIQVVKPSLHTFTVASAQRCSKRTAADATDPFVNRIDVPLPRLKQTQIVNASSLRTGVCYLKLMVEVLVVESSELGGLLATLLEEYGISARWALTSEQALEMALSERPKVVVVELELPDANGLDLAELVKPDLNAHVIVTYRQESVSTPEGAGQMARIAKLDGGFRKPFRSRALIELAAEFLGRDLDRPNDLPSLIGGAPVDESQESHHEDVVELFDEDIDGDLEDINLDDLDLGDLSPNDVAPAKSGGEAFVYTVDALQEDHRIEELPTPSLEERGSRVPALVEEVSSSASELSRMWADLQSRAEAPDLASNVEPPSTDGHPVLDPAKLAPAEGELSPRLLGDTLDAFHQSSTSGEIWLRRGQGRRAILLVRGIIVGARSNLAPELLSMIARRRNLIPDDVLRAAEKKVAARQSRNLVTALTESGVTNQTLSRLLDEQTRRIVLGAFTWQDGSCRLSFIGHGKREALQVRFSVGDALVRSIVLTESMEALRTAAPDDVRFAPNPSGTYGLQQLTLSPDEAKLIIAIDGTKTVGDLCALHPHLEERLIRGLAAGLFRIGVLRFEGKGVSKPRNISFF